MRCCCAFLLISLLSPLLAESQVPAASEILARSFKAYRNYDTLQMEIKIHFITEGRDGLPVPGSLWRSRDEEISMWLEPRAGRVRTESKPWRTVRVADGAVQYTYEGQLNEYVKLAAPLDLDALLSREIWPFSPTTKMRAGPTVLGEERLEIKGNGFECWVLQLELDSPGPEARVRAVKLWIDKTSALLLKRVIRSRSVFDRTATVDASYLSVIELGLNKPIPASRFIFEVPERAREVAEFSRSLWH
jgi:hypothetical protein